MTNSQVFWLRSFWGDLRYWMVVASTLGFTRDERVPASVELKQLVFTTLQSRASEGRSRVRITSLDELACGVDRLNSSS